MKRRFHILLVACAAALVAGCAAARPCSGEGDCAGSGWANEYPTINCPMASEGIQ
jgi:hypothetical protein